MAAMALPHRKRYAGRIMSGYLATSPENVTGESLRAMGAEDFHEFVRYLMASGVALIVDFGTLALFTSIIGVPYLYSGCIAFLAGLAVIYILSRTWVFASRSGYSTTVEFLLFSLIGIFGLLINEMVLWVLTSGFGLFYLYSKMASVAVVFTWNFTARKWLLFKRHHV